MHLIGVLNRNKILSYMISLPILIISLLAELKTMGIGFGVFSVFIYVLLILFSSLPRKKTIIEFKNVKQIFSIFSIFYLFVHSAILGSQTNITHTLRAACCSIIFTGGLLFILYYFASDIVSKLSWTTFLTFIKRNKNLFIILIIAVDMRIIQFGTVPIFDAEAYYQGIATGCLEFDFSISNFLKNFMVATHPTFGYCFFLSIGEFLFPGKIYGVYAVNLVLTIFAIYFIYKLLRYFLPSVSENLSATATLIISSVPMFLGTFSYVNMDYGIAIFLIYTAYMYIKKKYLLGLFFSLILLTTKEVGIVIYTGFVFGVCISKFFKLRGNILKKFIQVIKQRDFIFMVIPFLFAFLWILLVITGKVSFWNPTELNSSSSSLSFVKDATANTINVFAFNSTYILYRLKQTFIFNGYWLITIILIVNTLILVYKKTKKISYNKIQYTENLVGIIFAGIFSLLFSCVYMTYELMRYNILIELVLIISTMILFIANFTSNLLNKLCLFITLLLAIIQSNFSIDPVTNSMTQAINTQKQSLRFTAENTSWLGDPLVYNYHYNYINRIIDGTLKDINYKGDYNIIVANEELSLWPNGRFGTFSWNTEKQQREFSAVNRTSNYPIKVVYGTDMTATDITMLEEQAILLILPIYNVNEADALQELENFYDIGNRHTINDYIWGEGYYYDLTLKTN